MKAISQLVVEALWAHLRSLPPKLAMVDLVVTAIVFGAMSGILSLVDGGDGLDIYQLPMT